MSDETLRPKTTVFFWVAETRAGSPATYAAESGRGLTESVFLAHWFNTREECDAWIAGRDYVAREHGIDRTAHAESNGAPDA